MSSSFATLVCKAMASPPENFTSSAVWFAPSRLFKPETLDKLLPDPHNSKGTFQKNLSNQVMAIKQVLNEDKENIKYVELLEFIQEELTQSSSPRKFLMKSALDSLKDYGGESWGIELQKLERLIQDDLTMKEMP
jgi:hypothetical protein